MAVKYRWEMAVKNFETGQRNFFSNTTLGKLLKGITLSAYQPGQCEVYLVKDSGPYAHYYQEEYATLRLHLDKKQWFLDSFNLSGTFAPKRFDKEVEDLNKRSGLLH